MLSLKRRHSTLQLPMRKSEVPIQKGHVGHLCSQITYAFSNLGICDPGWFCTKGMLLGDARLLPLGLQGICLVPDTHPSKMTPLAKAPSFSRRHKLLKITISQRPWEVWDKPRQQKARGSNNTTSKSILQGYSGYMRFTMAAQFAKTA